MSITTEDVEKIASLAKLRFTRAEKAKLVHQLREILSYIDKLNELDTDQIAPTHHVLNLTNVFRDDQIGECLDAGSATSNAPDKIDHYFGVPRVIDQDSDAK